MDSIVVFDQVLVPWNRVFFYDNVEATKDFMTKAPFMPLPFIRSSLGK